MSTTVAPPIAPRDPPAHTDPEALIQEARDRARRRRRRTAFILLAVAAAGGIGFGADRLLDDGAATAECPADGCSVRPITPATALTFFAVNTGVGRARFHLNCSPASGDLPNNAAACAALASTPTLVTRPEPVLCELSSVYWTVTISGRLQGRQINTNFSTCWVPQVPMIAQLDLWQELYKHLLPRRHRVLVGGEQRTFAPGVMRPSDLVTCKIRGRNIELGVPAATGGRGSRLQHAGGTLKVARHPNGTVSASCHVGYIDID